MKRRQFIKGAAVCMAVSAIPLSIGLSCGGILSPDLFHGQTWINTINFNGYHIHADGSAIRIYEPELDLIDWEHEP